MNWKRLLLSTAIGLVVMVLQALLLQSTVRGTIFKGGLMADQLSYDDADCQKIPVEFQKYCGNVTLTRYGYSAVVATATQNVPQNDYVTNYTSTARRFACPPTSYAGSWACTPSERVFDSTSALETDDTLWVAINFMVAVAVVSALVYLGLQKFMPEEYAK